MTACVKTDREALLPEVRIDRHCKKVYIPIDNWQNVISELISNWVLDFFRRHENGPY